MAKRKSVRKKPAKSNKNGKKTVTGREATQFKPGNPGGGRPRLPEDIKEARKALKFEFERTGMSQLRSTSDQLKKILSSPESSALEMATASIILKAVTKSDHLRLDFILNRLIGRIPVKTTLTDDDGEPASLRVTFPNGEALQIGGLFPKSEGDQ